MPFVIEPNSFLGKIPAAILIHLSILAENPAKYNIAWWIVSLKGMEMTFKNAKNIQKWHS